MNNTFKTVIALGGTLYVGAVVVETVKIIRSGRKERAEIERESKLDIEAIKNAANVMTDRIQRGYYDGKLTKMFTDLDQEIEFEKIAVRYNK